MLEFILQMMIISLPRIGSAAQIKIIKQVGDKLKLKLIQFVELEVFA